MAQTSYYAKLDRPELSKGYAFQFGYAKFAKKAKTATIATTLKAVKCFGYTWRTGTPATTSGIILGTSGTVTSGLVRATRATLGGGASGATFWYQLIGW